MKKQFVREAIQGLKESKINFVAGLPDSWTMNLVDTIQNDPGFKFVPVCNEGIGFGICAGAWCGGKRPALIMENSGLRVASESIARISLSCNIPVVLLISFRGDVGERHHYAIGHGITTKPFLRGLRMPFITARKRGELHSGIIKAARWAFVSNFPAAVLLGEELIL